MSSNQTPKRARKPRQQHQVEQQAQQDRPLNISEIDLSKLTLDQLVALRNKVSSYLATKTQPANENDILLEYSVKMYTSEGLRSTNEGTYKMNGILHHRVLVDAPSRFEQSFIQQVFTPLNTDLYDVLEGVNSTDNSLKALPSNGSEHDAAPGLQIPTIKPLNIIPGE